MAGRVAPVRLAVGDDGVTESAVAVRSVAERAAAGAGWIIAWRMVTRNIGLLSTLILVRLLLPTDFGLVALATGFISAVDAVLSIGVQDALVRAPTLERDLYDTGFGLSVIRGIITALLIAGIAYPIGDFFDDDRLVNVMLALSAGCLVGAFENIGIVDFRRDLAFRKEFDMQLWSRVISVCTTITVAAIWHSYWALVAGILAFRVVRLFQSYLMSPYRPRIAFRAWRRIIGFSLWTWGQLMVQQAGERAEGIVIGRALGASQVGVFAVGLELGALPTTELVEPAARALFSGFAALHNASERVAGMFLGAVGLVSLVTLPAGFGISIVADPMVRLLLGEHWLAAVPIVQIMSICSTVGILGQTCANVLNATGRPNVGLYIGLVSTAVKLVALLLLVPKFGLPGAAAALVIATGPTLLLLLWLTLPRIRVSPRQLIACIVRPIIATAVMVIILRQLGMAWTPSGGENLIDIAGNVALRVGVGATCYAIVLTGSWLAAGRPEGAERFVIIMITDGFLRRLAGLAR